MREDVKELLEKAYIGYVLIGIQKNENIQVVSHNPHKIEGIIALDKFNNTVIRMNSEPEKWEKRE